MNRVFIPSKNRVARTKRGLLSVAALAAATNFCVGMPARAATLYWDGTDTTNDADGGSGTWSPELGFNGSTKNWRKKESKGASVSWSDNSEAVFGGAAGTVSIAQGYALKVGGMTFNTSGYTIAGDSLEMTGSAEISIGGTDVATITSALYGSAGLTKSGTGTLTLSGNNYYNGTTTLAGGSLVLANGNALGSSGTIAFTGGTLRFTSSNANDYSSRLSAAADQQFRFDTNGQIVSFQNTFGAAGSTLEKLGEGTLRLTARNNNTGATTITAGTLELVADASTGSGAIVNNAELLLSGYATRTVANTISGAGVLTLTGGGVTTLTGNNSAFTGAVAINGGTLSLGSADALGSNTTGGAIGFGGGTLAFTAVNTRDYSARFSSANGNSYRFDTGGQTVTFATAFGGAASNGNTLFKTGAGTLVLNAALTHTGGTTVAGGLLRLGDGGSLGTGAVNFASDGTPGNPGLVFANTGALTVANAISGYGSVTQSGAGVTTLSGANTYGGDTTINAGGTIRVIDGGAIGSGSVTNNGVLKLESTGAITLAGNIAGTGNIVQSGTGTTTITGYNTSTGGISLEAGTLSVVTLANGGQGSSLGSSSNAASNLLIAGGATLAYTGATNTTTDRSFSVTGDNTEATLANNGAGTVDFSNAAGTVAYDTAGQARTIALAGTNTGDNVFRLKITDNNGAPVTLKKLGAGRWTMTGLNTFTGATSVSAGTLLVNGSNAASAVTVESGATIGGSGTVGAITLKAGATLSPGANGAGSLGTLNAGALVWNGGGTLKFDLGAPGTGDKVALTGILSKGAPGGYLFDFNNTGSVGAYTLVTASTITGFTASDFTFANLGAGLTGNFVVNPGGVVFNVTVIPETGYAVGAGTLAALLAVRRRIRRR